MHVGAMQQRYPERYLGQFPSPRQAVRVRVWSSETRPGNHAMRGGTAQEFTQALAKQCEARRGRVGLREAMQNADGLR